MPTRLASVLEHVVAARNGMRSIDQLAGLDLGEVEDVVDDAQQRLGRPVACR
jgi:hypothetical protein